MTIPIVRKRAKTPKTRTGCFTCRARHVKCDEAKPTCRRCSTAGRICDGYPSVSSTTPCCTTAAPLLVLPRPPNNSTGSSSKLTDREGNLFDFFRRQTVHNLPGSSFALSWSRLVLSMEVQEPAITHIAIALGSLHLKRCQSRELGLFPAVADEESTDSFALDQCNKAIVHLRKKIDDGLTTKLSTSRAEVVVLVSLLLFCFEVWSVREHHAGLHLRSGMRILYDCYSSGKKSSDGDDDNSKRMIKMDPQPRSTLAVLLQTYVRLDQDLTIIHNGHSNNGPYLHPVVSEPLPVAFRSLQEARVHLDAISSTIIGLSNELREVALRAIDGAFEPFIAPSSSSLTSHEITDCLAGALSRAVSLAAHPKLARDLENCAQSVQRWIDAFAAAAAAVQMRGPESEGESESEGEIAHISVQMQSFLLWLEVVTWRDADEMLVDRFEGQFVSVLGLAERYVALHGAGSGGSADTADGRPAYEVGRPVFSLGTCLVTCVSVIAMKCRTTWVRRRCIDLLGSIDLRGIFDSDYVVSLVRAVVDLEEARARSIIGMSTCEDLRCEDIPREARLIDIDIGKEGSPYFYKADCGRLTYAWYGADGAIQVDATTFVIERL